MAYCTNCGKPMDESASYCSDCGSQSGKKTTQNNDGSFTDRVEKEARNFMNNKEPFIAAILSFIFPGLGQVYNGEFKKGLFIQIAYIITWMAAFIFFLFALIPIVILIFAIYDAYTNADKMRKGIDPVKNPSLKEIVIFLFWPIILIFGIFLLLMALVIIVIIIALLAGLFAVVFGTLI